MPPIENERKLKDLENQKKPFLSFLWNREREDLLEMEDTTPNLKYFFKLFGRRFPRILTLNLMMLVQVLLFLWLLRRQQVLLILLEQLLRPFLRMMAYYQQLVLIYRWSLLSSTSFLFEWLTTNLLFLLLMASLGVVLN